jgi:putative SOS response-associated peptidase YedK
MCGRYTLADRTSYAFDEISGVRLEWNGRPRYNIAPSQRAPVIRLEHGLPVITELRWGLVPSWAKDEKIAYSLINARSETVAEKPAFRSAFKKRRCLIPADGFYEWQQVGTKLKQPWRFVRPDRQPFLFAGLWEHWRNPADPAAEPLETFTILTTTPNTVAAPIHDRMPVILDGEARRQWLDEATPVESLASLLRPYPDERLTRYAVPALVGSPKNDVPECIAPIDALGLG